MGQKFSTPVIFWVEDLTVYFLGFEKSARIFFGSNFRQANSSLNLSQSSRKIQKYYFQSYIFLGAQYKVHVFFWVQYTRLRLTPPSHLYPSTPPGQPSPLSTSVKNSVGRPPSRFENASKRTQRRIKKNIKIYTKQKIDELKAAVEKMGASYEEICKEILEREFEKERQVGNCLQ